MYVKITKSIVALLNPAQPSFSQPVVLTNISMNAAASARLDTSELEEFV
jgi:hypothetical protein